jgi:putative methionine-R-sulfoxide reductase with GAF domain
VDESHLLAEICRVLESNNGREEKAARVAEVIRRAGDYRWVGVYEVTEDEIVNVAFSGPGAPVYPRFPITQGLSGAAVSSEATVVAGDVAEDPRYHRLRQHPIGDDRTGGGGREEEGRGDHRRRERREGRLL